MKKNYKIEKRPTIWQVVLESGEYSDYSVEYLHFRANSPEEAWLMLCEYKDSLRANYIFAMTWGDKKYAHSDKRKEILSGKDDWKDKINWDTNYGDACRVKIEMFGLICFSRLRKLDK